MNLRDPQNRKSEQTFVKIKMEDGQSQIVSLGEDTRSLEELDLEQGDQIRVWGNTEQINDKEVLMAQKVRISTESMSREAQANLPQNRDRAWYEGQGEPGVGFLSERYQEAPAGAAFMMADTSRDARQTQRWMKDSEKNKKSKKSSDQRKQKQMKEKAERDFQQSRETIAQGDERPDYNEMRKRLSENDLQVYTRGKIEDIKQVRLRDAENGQEGTHTLVKLALADGDSTILNLGQSSGFENIELEQGQEIVIEGYEASIDGSEVVMVNEIRTPNSEG